MSNFFVLNVSIELVIYDEFILGMSELVAIDREKEDVFIKHDSIYELVIIDQLYSKFGGFTEQAISKYIEQLNRSETYIPTEIAFDDLFPDDSNAFLGIDFSSTNISPTKQIINNTIYKEFVAANLWTVTYRNLWSKRDKLFPNIILCGDVEEQISKIGNSAYFNQIVERLREFNNAIEQWTSGEFNYREINNRFPLRISPESDRTMDRFGNERICRFPNGGTAKFILHIKTGDLRFHFFPDTTSRKVYIGYIGPHLTTVTN
jgi:hypothetical protein